MPSVYRRPQTVHQSSEQLYASCTFGQARFQKPSSRMPEDALGIRLTLMSRTTRWKRLDFNGFAHKRMPGERFQSEIGVFLAKSWEKRERLISWRGDFD